MVVTWAAAKAAVVHTGDHSEEVVSSSVADADADDVVVSLILSPQINPSSDLSSRQELSSCSWTTLSSRAHPFSKLSVLILSLSRPTDHCCAVQPGTREQV